MSANCKSLIWIQERNCEMLDANDVHSIVSANCKPELVLGALKANATRFMREAGLWSSERSPWVYRGSKRYLWTEKELLDAIAYVLYDQGEPLHE